MSENAWKPYEFTVKYTKRRKPNSRYGLDASLDMQALRAETSRHLRNQCLFVHALYELIPMIPTDNPLLHFNLDPIPARTTFAWDDGSRLSRLADISTQRTNMVYDSDPRPIKHYEPPVSSVR